MRATGLASLLVLATACGGGGGGAAPESLRLTGRLESSKPGRTASPIRLAMAWYPAFGATGPTSPPAGVVPQERVTFEGDFPIQFSFEVEGRPPAKALYDLSTGGGRGHIAYGVLIAYEDGNGNRSFDPIPAGGTPIDHIVGLSVPDPSLPPPPRNHFVVYLDGKPAPGDYWAAFSLKQGYNLIEGRYAFGAERIPLESDISIPITRSAALDLYACSDIFTTLYLQQACGIDPFGGTYQAQGNFFSTPLGSDLYMYVSDGNGNRADATITLDGADVAYDAGSESYYWWSDAVLTGSHTVTISVPGHTTETLPFTLPDPLAIAEPLDGAVLGRNTPIPISWSAAAGTAYYDIYFLATDTSRAWLFHDLPSGTSVTTSRIPYTGPARLSVKAIGAMAVGTQGSFLTPVAQDTVSVTFAP